MARAIAELQTGFLSPEQVEASKAVMGLDTQLIADGCYFLAEIDGRMAGSGGWSRRATLYGGDHSAGRDARLLDPATEPARIRAMYTDPGPRPPRRRQSGAQRLRGCGARCRVPAGRIDGDASR